MNPENLSYDIRIWNISTFKGKRATTYTVRWVVAGSKFQETFSTRKLAESFRAKLTTGAREGEPFDKDSGLPLPMMRSLNRRTCFEHFCDFVDSAWGKASARHRKNIAEALTTVTIALLPPGRSAEELKKIRSVLRLWAFNKNARNGKSVAESVPPAEEAARLRWIADNSPDLTKLRDAPTMRKALDAISMKLDGVAAAPATVARKRSAFYSAMDYAVELEVFEVNPIPKPQRTKTEKTDDAVDRRVVANPSQARRLIRAAGQVTPELEALFALMYFAALRPSEALHLSETDCFLPEQGWGELVLTGSTGQGGRGWTNSGEASEDRSLKHRAPQEVRVVPACPELVRIVRHHLATFGTGSGGRLFVTRVGHGRRPLPPGFSNPVSQNVYGRVWRKARALALTPAQVASPLARRPYDLRHAGVSLQLNAGVDPTQVAEWAGHSLKVLLTIYAKCLDGREEVAKRRIELALREETDRPEAA